jgi:hypothetical protein
MGWNQSNGHENGDPIMLVLSRKSQESVVVGGAGGFERLLELKVLEISGEKVKLGLGDAIGLSRDSQQGLDDSQLVLGLGEDNSLKDWRLYRCRHAGHSDCSASGRVGAKREWHVDLRKIVPHTSESFVNPPIPSQFTEKMRWSKVSNKSGPIR